jgi:hypothetical protein
MTAGIGERHHAEAGAVLTRPALLRRSQFRSPQEGAHRLAAEAEAFLGTKLFPPDGNREAPVLAGGQAQTTSGGRKPPRAWGARDCHAVPGPRNRVDNGG